MHPSEDRLDRLVALALDGTRRPALVLHEPGLVPDVAALQADGPVTVQPWDRTVPEQAPRTVLLAARDAGSLRQAVPLLSGVRWSREMGVVLLDADRPVPVRPSPLWPAVTAATARLVDGGAVTVVELATRAPGHDVLVALAQAAAPGGPAGHRGLRVAAPDPAWAPAADATVTTAWDPDAERPVDVLLHLGDPAGAPAPAEADEQASAVTGRAAAVVDPGLGALDAAVWTPVGRPPTGDPSPAVDLPADARLTLASVADLAGAEEVRVRWPAAVDRAWLRTVAGLALAGVPLVAPDPVPSEARRLLGDALADALGPSGPSGPGGPGGPGGESRDERCRTLRRAAVATHADPAWRRRVGAEVGVRTVARPRVEAVPVEDHRPDPVTLRPHALGSDADLLLLHDAGLDADDVDRVGHDLVDARELTGADVVGTATMESWGGVGTTGPLLLDRIDVLRLELTDPDDEADLLTALRRHGATTYAVPGTPRRTGA